MLHCQPFHNLIATDTHTSTYMKYTYKNFHEYPHLSFNMDTSCLSEALSARRSALEVGEVTSLSSDSCLFVFSRYVRRSYICNGTYQTQSIHVWCIFICRRTQCSSLHTLPDVFCAGGCVWPRNLAPWEKNRERKQGIPL